MGNGSRRTPGPRVQTLRALTYLSLATPTTACPANSPDGDPMQTVTPLLDLIRQPPPLVTGARSVRDFFDAAPDAGGAEPFLAAMHRALAADRPGFALACGHQGALRALIPGLPQGLTAFCASEKGGAHPRHITTEISPTDSGHALTGEKRWASLAPQADTLLIVASRGKTRGRNDLVSVLVPATAPGVSMTLLDAPGHAPEVGHAVVTFDGVALEAEAFLPGDGYVDAIKPFRTYEDLYIAAALQIATLRHGLDLGWPRDLLEDTLCVVLAASALAREDLRSPAAHIALASISRRCRALDRRHQECWAEEDPATSSLARAWHREAEPLRVAERAKERRREVAWQRFSAARSQG